MLFHETFAPRLENAEVRQASSYVKAMRLSTYRGSKTFFWTDKRGAQNKNLVLSTAMVAEVNRPVGPETIAFKYLEKGHTFMSPDSFHAQVEKGMRKKKNICDLDDFFKTVDSKRKAIEMTYLDFYLFENGVSSGRFTEKPLFNTVCSCMSRRGSSKLFLKTSFDDPVYQSGEFLKKKVATNLLRGSTIPVKGAPRGISLNRPLLTNYVH